MLPTFDLSLPCSLCSCVPGPLWTFGPADPPVMEHPNVEPTSDEELQLKFHSQLRKVGDPVDATFANLFIRSLEEKSLPVRVRKWKHRKIHLEESLQPEGEKL